MNSRLSLQLLFEPHSISADGTSSDPQLAINSVEHTATATAPPSDNEESLPVRKQVMIKGEAANRENVIKSCR